MRIGYIAVGLVLAGVACTPGGAAGVPDGASPGAAGPSPSPSPEAPSAGMPAAGAPPAGSGTHRYQTTASVGDFLQVTVDKAAHTVSYLNKTNGLTAADVPYTVDAKGTYAFTDPNGHLKAAIELEDYAFVIDVDKAGPNKDSRALAIGAATRPIALTDFASRRLNMMQFRTKNGGMEVGDVVLTTETNGLGVDLQSYWPRGAMNNGGHAFHVGSMGTLPVDQTTGAHDFLSITETQGGFTSTDYVFKTATGFAIDMSNGNIVMLEQPASKDFDPASAGSYRALAYGKRGAMGGPDDQPEPGDANVTLVDVTVDAAGHVTAVDADGTTLVDNDLTPVPDAPYLTGGGKLDPERSKGIFTYRTAEGAGFKDVFVIFTKDGMLFSSFTPEAGDGGDAPYDYFYGAAVKRR